MAVSNAKVICGFDCDFVVPPPKHLECSVCLLTLREPHVISCCGNHFCRPCIDRVQVEDKPCPLCNDQDFSVMLHKGVMREVNALKVRCSMADKGCTWIGELGYLESHVSPSSSSGGCGYVVVECVYGCGTTTERRLIREHEEEVCPRRPVDLQLKSGLAKVKEVLIENQFLRQEIIDMKEKLDSVMAENKELKTRFVKLEQATKTSSMKEDINDLKRAHEQQGAAVRELRKKIAILTKINRFSLALPVKPQDPLNVKMLQNLKERKILVAPRVEAAMKAIDRKHYAPTNHYQDSPQSIGHGATISAPHMHAHTLELLERVLCEGACVLDVGSGSGYLTACMAYLCGPGGGHAVGIDRVKELSDQATSNVEKDNPELLLYDWISLVTGDGRKGYAPEAPYDVIHVGGATPAVPQLLYDQLKCGGRMIVPVGPHGGPQALEQHDKQMDGSILKKRLMGVRYGPLV